LSPRAGHAPENLYLLHGSLFDVKCSSFFCNYIQKNNMTDPIVPALAIPTDDADLTTNAARSARELDLADSSVALPELAIKDLPHCPTCNGLLRPGVVWFGESLPSNVLDSVDSFIEESDRIDLILVIGTSASVFPAAAYIEMAKSKKAKVAVFNMDGDLPVGGLRNSDWLFQGDAAVLLPELLKPVIGDGDNTQERL
jgi:NAD-dependent deacetylase sirtuin 5